MSPVMLLKKDFHCGGVFSRTTGSGLNAVHRKLELKLSRVKVTQKVNGKMQTVERANRPNHHVGRFTHTFTVKQRLHCTAARVKQTLRPLVQNFQRQICNSQR